MTATKFYDLYCVKPNKYMRMTKKDVHELMRNKKADVMKRYGISKTELTRCYRFFSIKKWDYNRWNSDCVSRKDRLTDFWSWYENEKYSQDVQEIIKDLENNNNVQEFMKLLDETPTNLYKNETSSHA